MKKLALAFVILGSVASAHAALNLNIDIAYQAVARPGVGSIFVTFTGTVDVLLPTFDVTTSFLEFPGLNPGGPFLSAAFDSGFLAYSFGNSPGLDYTGALFQVEVTSTSALGSYWLNNSGNGLSNLSELMVTATDGQNPATDNEFFGVTVVPEPATFVALGLGGLVLLRRRRK
jgi:hypothetical protein